MAGWGEPEDRAFFHPRFTSTGPGSRYDSGCESQQVARSSGGWVGRLLPFVNGIFRLPTPFTLPPEIFYLRPPRGRPFQPDPEPELGTNADYAPLHWKRCDTSFQVLYLYEF